MSDLREVNINSQGFPIIDEGAREILEQKVSKTINNKEITITEEVSLYVGGYSTVNISASSATAFKYKLNDGSYIETTTPTKITINDATTLFLDSASYPITLTCDLISDTDIPLPRPITDTAKGSSITLTDGTDEPIKALSIMGKSTQVQTKGYQLMEKLRVGRQYTANGVTYKVLDNGRISLNGTATQTSKITLHDDNAYPVTRGTYLLQLSHISAGISVGVYYKGNKTQSTILELTGELNYSMELEVASGTEVDTEIQVMLESGSTAHDFESYTGGKPSPSIDYPQSIVDITSEEIEVTDGTATQTANLDIVLRGIPVSSGGNYTDNNNQQWICDTIERYADGTGKLIRRITEYNLDGTEDWQEETNRLSLRYAPTSAGAIFKTNTIICSHLQRLETSDSGDYCYNNIKLIYFTKNNTYQTVEELKAYLQNNNFNFQIALATPIETPLTPEQLAELDLDTYYPTTNINCNADVVVEYVADTKKYVDEGLDTKQDKTTITTNTTDTTVSLTLADNNEYRYTQDLASLTLTMPSGDFISSVVFVSGTTPTQMTYDSSIKWSGDDVVSNAFVPVANKTYNIVMWYDGININGIARGV